MGAGLELTDGERVLLWRALDRPLFVVGSNPECDLCVPDEAVAPIQAILRADGNEVVLQNRNPDGTQAGGSLVIGETRLRDGATIALGPLTATVRAPREQAAGKTRTLTIHSPGGPHEGSAVVVAAPEIPGAHPRPLGPAGVTVGSDAGNDIVLDDPYVSSFHARFEFEDGRCMVRDLGSRNGIFIADRSGSRKVKEAEVPAGSQVRIGKSVLVVNVLDPAQGHEDPRGGARMLGGSEAIREVRETIRRMALADAPVLITGETGTGKEVAARLLMELGPRAGGPMQSLNCGALGRNLIESELFGHEKGAFTGAVARKAGAFELAWGGTLFLDEIGELPLDLQPQLLRAVEYGEIRRVGGNESFRVDVRLIAATNRDLSAEVSMGRFREDLFHRLHVLCIELPPLRDRREDIPLLARHFVTELTQGAAVDLTEDAEARLVGHDWPGNVRELRNVLQRAVLMRRSDRITPDDLIFPKRTLNERVQARGAISGRTLAEIERDAILSELVRHRGRRAEAAGALGISRSTLHRKLEEYGVDVDALVGAKR